MSTVPCAMRPSIDRHFAGSIRPNAERLLRQHLPECDDCCRYYERHLMLVRIDPAALDAKTRIGRALGLLPPRRWYRPVLVPALVAVAAACLVVLVPQVFRGTPAFVSRGASEFKPAQAHLNLFRMVKGAAVPVAGRISGADELAFAYENAAGKERLMVFGVDEHRHVYWFFPAWQDVATDPEAIRIERSERPRELREAVSHKYAGKRLEVHALFTDELLTVREVERRLERGEVPLSPSALEHTVVLEVEDAEGR